MNEIIYAGKHQLTYSVSKHSHSSWEFIYCTGGGGILTFEDLSLPYREGDVVVIPPFIAHTNNGTEGFTNIHLNMLDPLLSLTAPMLIRDDDNHFILDAFQAAYYYFSLDPGKQSLLLSAYAGLIISQLQEKQSSLRHSPVVETIIGSIVRNYPDENYELDTFLHGLPFNYDYLRRLFQKEVGVTPHRYLSDIRLQTAAENLAISAEQTNGVSISEISRICGFREPLYFSRMFRKKYGLSPSQYQHRLKKDKAEPLNQESIKIPSEDA